MGYILVGIGITIGIVVGVIILYMRGFSDGLVNLCKKVSKFLT